MWCAFAAAARVFCSHEFLNHGLGKRDRRVALELNRGSAVPEHGIDFGLPVLGHVINLAFELFDFVSYRLNLLKSLIEHVFLSLKYIRHFQHALGLALFNHVRVGLDFQLRGVALALGLAAVRDGRLGGAGVTGLVAISLFVSSNLRLQTI